MDESTSPPVPESADEWTDPGFMDSSIWRNEPKPRIHRWVLRIGLATFVALPFLIASANLWGLPDVGPPSQLAEWRSRLVPASKNAAGLYQIAVEAITPRRLPIRVPNDWTKVSFEDREWLAEQTKAMKVWFAATSFEASDPNSARSLTDNEVQTLSRLAILEGLRLENAGKWDEAFDWYVALLRFGNHLKMRVGVRDWFRATVVHELAANRIKPWSDYPNLSTDLLRKALRDTWAVKMRSVPTLEAILFEADRVEEAYLHPLDLELRRNPDAASFLGGLSSKVTRWIQAEPERSKRLSRLIFANWVRAYSAEPFPSDGSGNASEGLTLFPDRSPEGRRVRTASIISRYRNARYTGMLMPTLTNFVVFVNGDEKNQADLILFLADRLYRRQNGKAPADVSDLLGKDLPELP